MTRTELIGRFYPVKSALTDEIIGLRSIKKAFDLANHAAYVIGLTNDDNEGLLLISYSDATQLTKDPGTYTVLD